jgi:hypothetical protein
MEIAKSVDEKEWSGIHPDDAKWCVAFGELMIQECLKSIYNHGKTYAYPSAGFHSAKGFADAIKNDFKLNDDNALRV